MTSGGERQWEGGDRGSHTEREDGIRVRTTPSLLFPLHHFEYKEKPQYHSLVTASHLQALCVCVCVCACSLLNASPFIERGSTSDIVYSSCSACVVCLRVRVRE